jgi:probable rRNA maturation factor
MQSLNSRYRGLDEPTDVLSFSLGERSGDRYVPGDIVVSLDMLEENSRYFGVSRDEELRRLLIHGILHLDGMDHKGTGPGSFGGFPEEPMLKKQEEILERFSPEHIISEA